MLLGPSSSIPLRPCDRPAAIVPIPATCISQAWAALPEAREPSTVMRTVAVTSRHAPRPIAMPAVAGRVRTLSVRNGGFDPQLLNIVNRQGRSGSLPATACAARCAVTPRSSIARPMLGHVARATGREPRRRLCGGFPEQHGAARRAGLVPALAVAAVSRLAGPASGAAGSFIASSLGACRGGLRFYGPAHLPRSRQVR